ncbi:hypothetical protein YC2023_110356 [Brassica napus]
MVDSSKPNPDPDILIFSPDIRIRSKSGSRYPPVIIIFRKISDTRISENPGSG